MIKFSFQSLNSSLQNWLSQLHCQQRDLIWSTEVSFCWVIHIIHDVTVYLSWTIKPLGIRVTYFVDWEKFQLSYRWSYQFPLKIGDLNSKCRAEIMSSSFKNTSATLSSHTWKKRTFCGHYQSLSFRSFFKKVGSDFPIKKEFLVK